jgi:hypothetical protein
MGTDAREPQGGDPGTPVIHAMEHLRHHFEQLLPDVGMEHLLEDLDTVEVWVSRRSPGPTGRTSGRRGPGRGTPDPARASKSASP